MKKLGDWVTGFEEAVIAFLLGLMTGVTFGQVIGRYVFHSGWLPALELTTTLFSWLVLFGMSYGIKIGAHLGVDSFIRLFPKPLFRACAVFGALVSVLYAVLLLNADWLRELFGVNTRGGAIDYWQRMYKIGIGLEDLRLPEFLMQAFGFRSETLPRWRMMKPPMVGVPFLVSRCDSGPSSRIGWPSLWRDLSQRMTAGPHRKHTKSAVITAPPVRNVR
jgi:C4-dicarboxylate transporter DctQ subunit